MLKRALATAVGLSLAAAPLLPATPAHADHTYVERAGVSGFSYGTQSYRTFTVWADVETEDPWDTDVQYSLEPTNPDCLVFEYGELTREYGNRFSGELVLSQSDLYGGNACAGDWVLEVSAFDWSSGGGYTTGDRTIVRFKRQSRIVNNNAGPEPVASGGTVRVTAGLQRASWETFRYGALGGRSAELQFKPSGGSYSTVKTVTSSSTGHLSASVRQYRDGCYRWVFRGFSTTAASTSGGDWVDVD